MNATVNSQIFAAELRLLSKIVPPKPAVAILGNVLVTADGNLRLYATDLEVGLSTGCAASVKEGGTITLPAARLLALVEQFADADVTMLADKSYAVISCGAFKSRLQAMPADDFPRPPEVTGATSVIDADVFRQLIGRVRYAAMSSGPKYALQGALVTFKGQVIAMAATDSKRLALATTGRAGGPDQRFIVPTKTLDVIARQADEGDVEVTVGERHLFFSIGDRSLTSRTIDSEFPKYERLIPRDNDKVVTIDRMVLTAALKRVAVVSEESRAVHLVVAPGSMELSSASSGIGTADETVRVDYDGPSLKVCINGDYVLDFLSAASGRTVTMSLKDQKSPALFADGDSHVAVVMLMRA